MHNFYRQTPPPVRPNNYYHGPGRMPRYGYPPPPPPPGFNSGRIPPNGAKAPSKIESFMETCNRFLATAQGFQPYIAQATPLIRNIPALWRLYKGFNAAPKEREIDDDYDNESSEFNIDSSSFEYVYKDDDHEHKSKHDVKNEHKYEEKHHHDKHKHDKTIRHKYESGPLEDINHKRGGNRFFPVRHESRREKEKEPVAVEKIARPLKTKPSVPRIFQPPYHFDE
ncbi:VrrA/YqfQ family protein [Ureibacillus manganicus]|uniref:YqfQ-like protein n=1 Tax=Ureibacillus manganicus DSM 26584 TaxID=1384049 RepID=A0A0A3I1B3_9BACL|nr:VrrA/YqfQ family protein [Ureibacillus manganicus]KGR78514.1 hypothetical protein CD29_10730 [Ureibacillus manganicus DSM 26584]